MARKQNNNDWLTILVAAAEVGYFFNRLNNNKVDAEYAQGLLMRLGLYGLLGSNKYDGQKVRQLTAGLNNALTQSTLNDIETQKKLTQKQRKSFITLVDNKPKVVDLLTNKENKTEALELKKIVDEVSPKTKFSLDNNQSKKLDLISQKLKQRDEQKRSKFILDEIYIDNYRILNKFRLQFSSNISIIIGENGSGKSTLIEYIVNAFAYLFLEFGNKRYSHLPNYDLGSFKFEYRFFNETGTMKVIAENDGNTFDPAITVNNKLSKNSKGGFWPDRFVISYAGVTDRIKSMIESTFDKAFIEDVNNDNTEYSILPNEFRLPRNWFYYADNKYLNLIYCALLFSKHEEAKILLDKVGVDFSRCEIKFQFGETYHKRKDKFKGKIAPLFFDTLSVLSFDSILIGNQLQDMFHEFKKDISSQEVFDILYYLKLNKLVDDIKISWENESGGFDLEHISEGQKQELMTLGLALVFDSPSTLFLLDEPDTYLHPKWQREFIPSLTKALEKGGCAIVTTHSPSVVSDVKKEQLTILRHGKIVETSFNNYGKEVGEILIDYFGLDSTRSKDVQARIDDLRNMIVNDEYETAEFKQKFEELSDLVGAADEELTLMKIDIKRREYAKNK